MIEKKLAVSNLNSKKKRRKLILVHGVLLIVSLILALPLLYAFVASTLSIQEIVATPPRILPGSNVLENYIQAWKSTQMGRLILNSTIIAIGVAVGKIILSLCAAFAFTYFGRFPGQSVFFVCIFITHMLPLPVRILPTYELMGKIAWLNTYQGLMVPFFASATGVLLFRQFFLTIPDQLADAARLDGATAAKFLTHVLAPLSRSNMAALFLIEFLFMWNEYLWPLLTTNTKSMRVVQIGIKMLVPVDTQPEWNLVMAAVMIGMTPPLIVLLALQRHLSHGIAARQDK